MRQTILLTLVLTLSSFAVYVQAQEETEPVGIDDLCGEAALNFTTVETFPENERTAELDAVMRRFVTLPTEQAPPLSTKSTKPPAPGAVVFVDAPGSRYFRAIGAADIISCEPLEPSQPFAIGSNTKMMTAAVIYQLQEEGLLTTSDLVSNYLPNEITLFEGAEPITIEMLLTHTSGLPDYLDSPNPTSIGSLDLDPESGALEMSYTPQELIANAAQDGPSTFAPGAEAQWAYSNTGYIMLGLSIEQVTGRTYIETVTERIIKPLGIENTVLVEEFASEELGLPSSYLQSPFTRETGGWNYTQAWSAGNAVSTAEDMAVFLRALYSGKLFQHDSTLQAMLTRAAPGYALETDDYYYMHGGYYKHGFLGHGGQTLGFMSDVGFHLESDTVIVVWANSAEAYTGQGVYHVGLPWV